MAGGDEGGGGGRGRERIGGTSEQNLLQRGHTHQKSLDTFLPVRYRAILQHGCLKISDFVADI